MDNHNLRWVDKDHVWINGVQFISLQRTGEMILEAKGKTSSQSRTEAQSDFPLERYRLTLRHDMLVGSDTVEIDEPFVVEYCMPRGRADSGPCVINWMLDRMRCEVLNKRDNEEVKP